MTPEQTTELFQRLVRAEAAVTGLRRALRRLVAAEKEFSRDTGIKLDDLITESVQSAEFVLERTKWNEAQEANTFTPDGKEWRYEHELCWIRILRDHQPQSSSTKEKP